MNHEGAFVILVRTARLMIEAGAVGGKDGQDQGLRQAVQHGRRVICAGGRRSKQG
ncbi:hypothetical protein D3C85_1895810 [compost metagenome]